MQTRLSNNSTEREGIESAHTNHVKLLVEGPDWRAPCHGSLVAGDLVLTVSHCLLDDWIRVKSYYGRGFENELVTERNDEKRNWVKFDTDRRLAQIDTKQIPPTDLALIKLPRAVTPEEGTVIAPVPKQDSCATSVGPVQIHQGANMPRNKIGIERTTVSGPYSVKGAGMALETKESLMSPGDSGSPLMTSKGELVGVVSGQGKSHDYAPALCKYSDELNAHARHLTDDEPQVSAAAAA